MGTDSDVRRTVGNGVGCRFSGTAIRRGLGNLGEISRARQNNNLTFGARKKQIQKKKLLNTDTRVG